MLPRFLLPGSLVTKPIRHSISLSFKVHAFVNLISLTFTFLQSSEMILLKNRSSNSVKLSFLSPSRVLFQSKVQFPWNLFAGTISENNIAYSLEFLINRKCISRLKNPQFAVSAHFFRISLGSDYSAYFSRA